MKDKTRLGMVCFVPCSRIWRPFHQCQLCRLEAARSRWQSQSTHPQSAHRTGRTPRNDMQQD